MWKLIHHKNNFISFFRKQFNPLLSRSSCECWMKTLVSFFNSQFQGLKLNENRKINSAMILVALRQYNHFFLIESYTVDVAVLVKGTNHDSILQISHLSTLADTLHIYTTFQCSNLSTKEDLQKWHSVQESQIFAVWINFSSDINEFSERFWQQIT